MNRLAHETSPYLRQHADNPVHWWPWSDEAFAEAQRRDLPVLLSIGYSTCHWCHVMAHESFEHQPTAELMNQHFVNIKVDREERPDVDAVYMAATQALSGQGGWPMTVFLTPQREPFYAGTYFPPEDGYGRPSFQRVLRQVSQTWQTRRETLLQNAGVLTEHLHERSRPQGSNTALPPDALAQALETLRGQFDPVDGGFGSAPKFPAPTLLDFLLTQPDGREMALFTLRKMAAGGLYDQLGGGFHRYSVDQRWLVPHFEKMLYDNAQLLRTLLRAYQLTQDEGYAQLVRDTLAYLEREMLDPSGGFYSAQDADTQGVEGLTFTWTPAELREVLGEEAEVLIQHYQVTASGHFSDPHRPEYGRRNILHRADLKPEPPEVLALKARLHAARRQRPQPGTDTKLLTSWNGLMLAALAEAARILHEPRYLQLALNNAAFVRQHLRQPDGSLRHTFKDGVAKVSGLLEDHALYALGLVALFTASGDVQHLLWARDLWRLIRRDFWDEELGVFFSTGGQAEPLLTRQAEYFDAAILSDNAAAAQLALWMARYFDDAEAEKIAQRTVRSFARELMAMPSGLGGLWQVVAFLEAPHSELVILGTPAERAALEREAARYFLPFTALMFTQSDEDSPLPALKDRAGGGTAYWCVDRVCQLPVQQPEALAEQLNPSEKI